MTRPRNLEHDDRISIGSEPLSGRTFRVSDVEVEDIGITETVAVTLVSLSCESHDSRDERGEASAREGADKYSMVGTTADSSFTAEDLETGEEYTVFAQHITVED
jgi:hypothetical protein